MFILKFEAQGTLFSNRRNRTEEKEEFGIDEFDGNDYRQDFGRY
jgi:hypothetical protein